MSERSGEKTEQPTPPKESAESKPGGKEGAPDVPSGKPAQPSEQKPQEKAQGDGGDRSGGAPKPRNPEQENPQQDRAHQGGGAGQQRDREGAPDLPGSASKNNEDAARQRSEGGQQGSERPEGEGRGTAQKDDVAKHGAPDTPEQRNRADGESGGQEQRGKDRPEGHEQARQDEAAADRAQRETGADRDPAKASDSRERGGKREIPQSVRDRWDQGREFNKQREPHYTDRGGGNELTLENGKRVDSYVPNKEIVSRKHTQLSDVNQDTGKGYVRELDQKYGQGEVVKDTPHARQQIGDHAGKPMRGDKILEVPPQQRDVPEPVLREADNRGVTIRDTNGKVYQLPSETERKD